MSKQIVYQMPAHYSETKQSQSKQVQAQVKAVPYSYGYGIPSGAAVPASSPAASSPAVSASASVGGSALVNASLVAMAQRQCQQQPYAYYQSCVQQQQYYAMQAQQQAQMQYMLQTQAQARDQQLVADQNAKQTIVVFQPSQQHWQPVDGARVQRLPDYGYSYTTSYPTSYPAEYHASYPEQVVRVPEGGYCLDVAGPVRIVGETCLALPQQRQYNPRRKTLLCKFWNQGTCTRGDKCDFAHGVQELQSHNIPKSYHKTCLCQFWLNGSCKYGSMCTFAHGTQELRQNPKNSRERDLHGTDQRYQPYTPPLQMQRPRSETVDELEQQAVSQMDPDSPKDCYATAPATTTTTLQSEKIVKDATTQQIGIKTEAEEEEEEAEEASLAVAQ